MCSGLVAVLLRSIFAVLFFLLCLAAVFVAVWFGPWCFLVVAVLLLTFCCLFAVVSLSCCCCLVAVLCTRVFAWPESYVAILRLRPSVNGKDDSIINRATATGPQHATFDLLNCWGVLVTQQSWLIVAICRKASGCAFARASRSRRPPCSRRRTFLSVKVLLPPVDKGSILAIGPGNLGHLRPGSCLWAGALLICLS